MAKTPDQLLWAVLTSDAVAKKLGVSRRTLYNWKIKPPIPLPITTKEVAKKIGVSRGTLYNWIDAGLLRAPDPERFRGLGIHYRFWFEEDLARARKLKGTLKAGRPKSKNRGKRNAR